MLFLNLFGTFIKRKQILNVYLCHTQYLPIFVTGFVPSLISLPQAEANFLSHAKGVVLNF